MFPVWDSNGKISIHALREESDGELDVLADELYISIHALREESDPISAWCGMYLQFQSTLSVRRATMFQSPFSEHVEISIHALREESDSIAAACCPSCPNFNPRSP